MLNFLKIAKQKDNPECHKKEHTCSSCYRTGVNDTLLYIREHIQKITYIENKHQKENDRIKTPVCDNNTCQTCQTLNEILEVLQ